MRGSFLKVAVNQMELLKGVGIRAFQAWRRSGEEMGTEKEMAITDLQVPAGHPVSCDDLGEGSHLAIGVDVRKRQPFFVCRRLLYARDLSKYGDNGHLGELGLLGVNSCLSYCSNSRKERVLLQGRIIVSIRPAFKFLY